MATTIFQNRTRVQPHPPTERRSMERLLAPLDSIAENSERLLSQSLRQFENAGRIYSLPRYVYLGVKGGGDAIRVGIFATIHGDEPEGALAIIRLLSLLEIDTEVAKGYALFLYPICNPTGFEDNTRHSRAGKDWEFWTESSEPEVRHLESETYLHAFHGIITLHSDNGSPGVYGFASGTVLSESLLEPALREAERFLPRNRRRVIDGLAARRGIITGAYDGALKAVPGLAPPPFEITLGTPQKAPLHLQVEAFVAALRTILIEYRYLIAIAQNI